MTGLGNEYMHRCSTPNTSAAGLLAGVSEGCNRGTSAGVVDLGLAIGHEPSGAVQTSKGPRNLCVETSTDPRGRSMFGGLKMLQSKCHISDIEALLCIPSD